MTSINSPMAGADGSAPVPLDRSRERRGRAFRDCVGTFPTGVTVVATEHRGVPAGMTLNSFISVSCDPLLICVSLAHETRTREFISRGAPFTVSILRAGQEDIARAFSVPGSAFPRALTSTDARGRVRVAGALAILSCSPAELVTAGDHDLVIARVEDFETRSGEPLVFQQSGFTALHRPSGFGERTIGS